MSKQVENPKYKALKQPTGNGSCRPKGCGWVQVDKLVGSKIVITKPDSVSIERNALNGDIGKIVCIETDVFGVTRYLAYNPKWKCRDDGMQEDFGYDGLFIVLSRREFEVIRYENKSW